MNYHEYETGYQAFKRRGAGDMEMGDFYLAMKEGFIADHVDKVGKGLRPAWPVPGNVQADVVQCDIEACWILNNRPYYKVSPQVVDAMLKLDTRSLPDEHYMLPDPMEWGTEETVFALRFAEPVAGFTSALFSRGYGGEPVIERGECVDWSEGPLRISVWAQTEKIESGLIHETYFNYTGPEGRFLNDNELAKRFDKLMSIAVSIRLLNDEMLTFDALAKDRGKPVTPEIIARAQRRRSDGYGWLVDFPKVKPGMHYRNPCLALYWTGKGRETPEIKMRRGTYVNPYTPNPEFAGPVK